MKVRVWNKNEHVLKDQLRGDPIVIEPGKFVIMEDDDANIFKGQYIPIYYDAGGLQDPRSYKILHIEPIEEAKKPEVKIEQYACVACGRVLNSKDDLDKHVDEFHLDSLADPEVAEKRRGRPPKSAA